MDYNKWHKLRRLSIEREFNSIEISRSFFKDFYYSQGQYHDELSESEKEEDHNIGNTGKMYCLFRVL